MRETTMKRNPTFIVLTLGVAALLAGCSSKSPTAPKPTPIPALSISLTASPNPANVNESSVVVAMVTSASGNAPDGTAVTFIATNGLFVDSLTGPSGATQVIRTTTGGRAATNLTSSIAGPATVEGRVAGGSNTIVVTFGVGPTPTPPVKNVAITAVTPNQGGTEGGDRVVITGNGFVQPLQVNFVVAGQPFAASIVYVATDGTSMTVVTPRVASTPPATQDQLADVTVTAGPYSDTLKGGFTYLAEELTPVLYALSPTSGPFEGGTQVTITGKGFQYPVQVLFGTNQAQIVSSNYTQVVCISPSITPTAPTGVTTLNVTVTNITNGQSSNGLPFQYGVTMFISSFSPMEGPADTPTTVTIFGQGFVAPVSVVASAGGQYQWDIQSVAGTEIVASSKPIPENARTCSDVAATLTVTNINSNTSFTASNPFTYRAVHPLISSVQIDGGGNTVQQFVSGTCTVPWTSHTVTINGSGFEQGMTVRFDGGAGGSAGPVVATYLDSHTLTLTLPDLTALGLQTVTCNDGGGVGQRNVATPVGVTVINPHNTCEDSLGGAVIINPCVTTCQILAAPTVTSVSSNNGPIAGSTSVYIYGTNFVNSSLSVTIGGAPATGVTFIDANTIQAMTPAHTPAGPVAVTVFCGGQNGSLLNAFTYTATMDVTIVGTGTVDSTDFNGAFSCSTGSCQALFGTSVPTLTVTTGGTFNGWSGATCGCSGTGSCMPTMNQNRACTATFTP
jgi:alpha-D-ribose 1-methylphosphonate 5-triphosphate synthase subunit PhnH